MAALTAANSVVAGGQALPEDTAERQHREWYDDERNHLFHSKSSSRIVREPALTGYAYAKLVRKKNALLTFYISLLQARLGFPNISGGGLTYAGFEAILERYELGTFTAHTEDDAEPAHSSSSAALLRELHGEPNGEGYYKCREVPVPTTRRVQRWLSEIDGQPATWSDLGGAVLELDDRDTLSISLHLMNGVTSFKKHFLT